MQTASSSVAQVTTRIESSLSSAARTVFWCVSGTLRIQPRWVCTGGSATSAARAARASRNVSFSVSMISDAGMDSGILPPALQWLVLCETGWMRGAAGFSCRSRGVAPPAAGGADPVRALLGHSPHAGVARGPVGPALDVLPPRRDLRDVHGRVVGQVGPPELLELGVDLGAVLGLHGLPPLLAEAVVLRAVVAGLARLRLVGLAVVDVGVRTGSEPR